MSDEDEWEHHIIKNIVWSRHKGYVVESEYYGNPAEQSIEPYTINDVLIQMIRDSPHNTRRMVSVIEREQRDAPATEAAAEAAPAPVVTAGQLMEHV